MELTQDSSIIIEPKEMRVLKVSGHKISAITKALKSPTRQKILQILKRTPMDVSKLAKELDQTEAMGVKIIMVALVITFLSTLSLA